MRVGELRLVIQPSEEPVTLEQAKDQVRRSRDFTADDATLGRAIRAARRKVEGDTARQLITATYELRLFSLAVTVITPPVAPLISVTGVQYLDTGGALQTLDPSLYVVQAPSGDRAAFGSITRTYGAVWPTTRCQADGVRVGFTAGYGGRVAVPDDLVQAMLLLIGAWYQQREAVVVGTIAEALPLGYDALVQPYALSPVCPAA